MALPTTWTYPISRRFNARPLLEVAIDPDGKNIKLDGFNDLASAPNLVSEFVINPEQMQTVVVNDLTLQLNDVQQYFNKFNRRLGPNNFRNTYALLEVAITATDNFCFTNLQKVTYDTTAYDNCRIFMIGDTVKITDGANTETMNITAVAWAVAGAVTVQKLTFSSNFANSYAISSLIAMDTLATKDIEINFKMDELDGDYSLWRGVIIEPFSWANGQAQIVCENWLAAALRKKITVVTEGTAPVQYYDKTGTLVTSIKWNTGSIGTLANVYVYSYAKIGKWTVTFSDATNFTVSGPGCNAKAGTTGTDFYDKTSAADSQIKIAIAYWGGTPATNDTVTFSTSLNYLSRPLAAMWSILNNVGINDAKKDIWQGGGATPYSYSDYTFSWNAVHNCWDSFGTCRFSFNKDMTIAECLSHILPHIMAFLAISDEGKIRIFTFHNTYSLPYLIGNIKSIDSISQTEFYNEIKLHYGWDGATSEYSQCYIYPTADTANPAYALSTKKRTVDIYCPGIYFDTAQAIPLAKRYYSVWNQGITKIELVAYIDNIDIQIGNKIQVDLGTDIGEVELTVIKAQKIIGSKNEIRLTGILQTDEYGDAL